MRGIDAVVIRGGTRSILRTMTMIGECGQGQGANQGTMAMMIIQGGGANFAYQEASSGEMVTKILGKNIIF
jgi:hypothetical protein